VTEIGERREGQRQEGRRIKADRVRCITATAPRVLDQRLGYMIPCSDRHLHRHCQKCCKRRPMTVQEIRALGVAAAIVAAPQRQ